MRQAGVLIRDSQIASISQSHLKADLEIDARGLYLLPGCIDPQVHFREPGLEWKEDIETGSMAAASGGVTTFLDMPNTIPNTTSRDAMVSKKALAMQKSLVNYNFFIGATTENLEELNETSNVCGIKIFMGSSTGDLLVDDPRILEKIFMTGRRLIAVHAEDEAILRTCARYRETGDFIDHLRARPVRAALKATELAVSLAKRHRRRLHVLHVTTEEEVELLRKEKTHYISAEVCPQNLLLHAPDVYRRLKGFAQMNPPIREKRHRDALWRGLEKGIIDCLATDHAPHTVEEKSLPYGQAPSGMPGVETALPLMLDQVNRNKCTLNQVVKWMCEQPATLYKLKNKGFLRVGHDADLTLVDMQREKTIKNGRLVTKANWSPFDNHTLKGWPIKTFVNGHLVYDEGTFFRENKGREVIVEMR